MCMLKMEIWGGREVNNFEVNMMLGIVIEKQYQILIEEKIMMLMGEWWKSKKEEKKKEEEGEIEKK